jgi:hypothetical protein
MQRFELQGAASYEDAQLWITCDWCGWVAVYDEPHALAELVQRAEEHTEVCR